jgi:hypothetical protein
MLLSVPLLRTIDWTETGWIVTGLNREFKIKHVFLDRADLPHPRGDEKGTQSAASPFPQQGMNKRNMMHEFTLILASAQVTDKQCNALFEAGCDDGTISTSQGVTRIDFAREAPSLEEAIRSAINNVHATGLQVIRAEITTESLAAPR